MTARLDKEVIDWCAWLEEIADQHGPINITHVNQIIETIKKCVHIDLVHLQHTAGSLTDLLAAASYMAERGNLWNHRPVYLIHQNADALFEANIFAEGDNDGQLLELTE